MRSLEIVNKEPSSLTSSWDTPGTTERRIAQLALSAWNDGRSVPFVEVPRVPEELPLIRLKKVSKSSVNGLIPARHQPNKTKKGEKQVSKMKITIMTGKKAY